MTLYEYEARMHAFRLSQVDREKDVHLQAWLNHKATAMKKQGDKQVSVYPKFKDFYDYEKELKEVEKDTSPLTKRNRKLAHIAKALNKGVK